MTAQSVRKIWLIVVTVLFSFIGLLLAWYTFTTAFLGENCWARARVWENGSIFTYNDQECVCNEGKIVCESSEDIIKDNELEIDDFSRENLDFTFRYVTNSVSAELELAPLKTVFKNIKNLENGIEVVLHQEQLCNSNMEPPVQVGLYHASKKSLVLMNVVNTAPTLYTQECTVETVFRITDFGYNPDNEYALSYRSEAGDLAKANICSYDGRLFNHADRYEASDKCNICQCDHGISRCSNDRICN